MLKFHPLPTSSRWPVENTKIKKETPKNASNNFNFLNFEKQKMRFFLMFQGPLKQKIRFLAQKMCPVARGQTNKQTNRQTDTKVTTEDTLSGLRIPFLQPTIKERSN